jgi:hypothetical protein
MSLLFDIETLNQYISPQTETFSLITGPNSLEKNIRLLIIRDLMNLNWEIKFGNKKIEVIPPKDYDKETIKQAMSLKRNEIIAANRIWIDRNLDFGRRNLANGLDVLTSRIEPVIEICKTRKQHDLFRIYRYFWSSPYSDYVGRRIKLLIRDKGLPNKPIIGIAALGSPIIHIPERDSFIGWDKTTRTKNLIYTMDAFVIGALPPYNYLLGGKLISMLIASKEVRKLYSNKYKNTKTIIEDRVSNTLVGIFTTSLYGKSSQYNRLKFNGKFIFSEIGHTKGFGTLHLSEETIHQMIKYLKSKNIEVNHRFGDGPSWIMRVIRTSGDYLGFDSDFLLKHSFKRSIYFAPLAINYKEVLTDKSKKPQYYNYSIKELTEFWRNRWLINRKNNKEILSKIVKFEPADFII